MCRQAKKERRGAQPAIRRWRGCSRSQTGLRRRAGRARVRRVDRQDHRGVTTDADSQDLVNCSEDQCRANSGDEPRQARRRHAPAVTDSSSSPRCAIRRWGREQVIWRRSRRPLDLRRPVTIKRGRARRAERITAATDEPVASTADRRAGVTAPSARSGSRPMRSSDPTAQVVVTRGLPAALQRTADRVRSAARPARVRRVTRAMLSIDGARASSSHAPGGLGRLDVPVARGAQYRAAQPPSKIRQVIQYLSQR